MKLLVEVNLSPRWTAYLAARGFEATHWSSLGPLNASDSTLMSYAAEHGFVIVTHDLDFSAILAARAATGRVSFKYAPTTSARRPSASSSWPRSGKRHRNSGQAR